MAKPAVKRRTPARAPQAEDVAASNALSNAAKLGLPLTAVACIVWFVASLVYGAGQKVSSSESSIASLTERLNALEKAGDARRAESKVEREAMRSEFNTRISADHDLIIGFKTALDDQAHNIDVLQRDQNNMPIELNVKDNTHHK